VSGQARTHAQYRFGDAAPLGLLLGIPARQAAPIIVGVLWLTMMLMAQLPLVGMPGPVLGVGVAFGRFRGVPLFEIALPALRLGARRRAWTRTSLLALDDARVFATFADDDVIAGFIANRAHGCVGVSNAFARDDRFDWGGCIATVGRVWPGLPIVGYESGTDLDDALAQGLVALGPLRVWASV